MALTNYYTICCEKDTRPTISGICLALGVPRAKFLEACETGVIPGTKAEPAVQLPREVWDFFVAVKDNYVSMLEGFMETGLIHPASGIFLLKNNADYKDVQEKRYTIDQNVVDTKTLAEKYKLESGE